MLTIGNDRREISYVIKMPDDIDIYPESWTHITFRRILL